MNLLYNSTGIKKANCSLVIGVLKMVNDKKVDQSKLWVLQNEVKVRGNGLFGNLEKKVKDSGIRNETKKIGYQHKVNREQKPGQYLHFF